MEKVLNNTWVVLASGQSLNQDQIEFVRNARKYGKIKGFIAVSNVGIDLAPDADALVSHDAKWWVANPKAKLFSGRKFSRMIVGGIETFMPFIRSGCNSGLMAMDVAKTIFKADRIIILGFDMHGTHYFGPHSKGLKNTTDKRFLRTY